MALNFSASGSTALRSLLGAAAVWLILIAVYVAFGAVSAVHQYKGLLIRPFNPGVGFMLAVIILFGYRYTLALILGSIATGVVVRHGILGFPGIPGAALLIAGCYAGAAWIVRERLRVDVRLNRLTDLLSLLAAGIGATIFLAVGLTLLLLALGRLQQQDIVPALLRVFIGNVIGIAVLAPLVMRMAMHWRERSLHRIAAMAPELAAYCALAIVILWTIMRWEFIDEYKYFYLLFLPMIAASVRRGLDGACIALAVAQFTLVTLLRLHDYNAMAFTEFQVLMFVLTATSLVVGVVVTEREEAARAVREAEARLKEREAEAAQTARFSVVSGMASSLAHEMNQPMTAARALARSAEHILQRQPVDIERAGKNIGGLIAQIDHASEIIRRTRHFLSRRSPHPTTLAPLALVEEAVALARADMEARHIALRLEVPADLPLIHGDQVQLQQVILNLVRNGVDSIVDAFPVNGQITIAARRRGDDVVFSVVDNGAGIKPEIADRLFQPLNTSKSEGLGLGLSICHSIVEQHGGRIWVQSALRGATEFCFSLPIQPLPAPHP